MRRETGPLQCKAAEPAVDTAAARVAPTTNKLARVGNTVIVMLAASHMLAASAEPHLHQVQRIHLQPLPAGVNALHKEGGRGSGSRCPCQRLSTAR